MEENKNLENQNQDETITMTKNDFNKAIQSAEDKLRTAYSAKIKELETKIPTQKTDSEIEFENRLKALEAKEKKIALQATLQSKNLDSSIADFLKDDVDVESFHTVIENLVSTRLEKTGYKPTGHTPNEKISKEAWAKMSYSQKQDFYSANPELAKKLMGV
jgi:hypothetical protein